MARPLHDLEKKDVKFNWGPDQQTAFDALKTAITTAPILAHANPDIPYTMESDTSNYAWGAILSQKQERDKRLHPVAFLSKSLSPPERNYDIYDKEMLAVVKALEYWRQYLQGTRDPIKILTDHKNLTFFRDAKITSRRHARWADLLSHYNYELNYRPGVELGKPDALSRRSDHRPEGGNQTNNSIFDAKAFASIAAIYLSDMELVEKIAKAIKLDKALAPIIAYLNTGPRDTTAEVRSRMEGYSLEEGVLYRNGKVYVPDNEDIKREIV